MYIDLTGDVEVVSDYRAFRKRKQSAVDKLPHEEWADVMRQAAKVDRAMRILKAGVEFMNLSATEDESPTIRTGAQEAV